MTTESRQPETIGEEEAWYRGPYLLLTIALFVTVILHPIFESLLGDNVQNTLLTVLMLTGLHAIRGHRVLFRLLGALILPVLAANWLVDSYANYPIIEWLTSIVTQLFLVMIMVTVFRDVLRARRVTADVIFGSVAAYVLFGVVIALIYQLMNSIDPGSVVSAVSAEATSRAASFDRFLYFSFITLTSVGFGDLTPISPYAQSVAVFEGVVGQLYLAILVARLVGIHIAQE